MWGCTATHKKGVLGTGTTPEGGRGLRHGHESKRGCHKNRHSPEKRGGVLRTYLVQTNILVTDVAQKGVLGSLFINYIPSPFSCQHDQLVWVCSDRLKMRGLGHGSGSKGGGGAYARVRTKRGSTAAHTCNGHMCQCSQPHN